MPITLMDAIAYMKRGRPVLKYCSWDSPHWRWFELSEDGVYLQWYSKKKDVTKSRIPCSKIEDVLEGQQTKGFKSRPQPEIARQSFSVQYSGGKTLDLIVMNANDYVVFTQALSQTIRNVKHKLEPPTHLPVIVRKVVYVEPPYRAFNSATWKAYDRAVLKWPLRTRLSGKSFQKLSHGCKGALEKPITTCD